MKVKKNMVWSTLQLVPPKTKATLPKITENNLHYHLVIKHCFLENPQFLLTNVRCKYQFLMGTSQLAMFGHDALWADKSYWKSQEPTSTHAGWRSMFLCRNPKNATKTNQKTIFQNPFLGSMTQQLLISLPLTDLKLNWARLKYQLIHHLVWWFCNYKPPWLVRGFSSQPRF